MRRGTTPVLPGRLEGDEFRIDRIPDKCAHIDTFDTGGASAAFTRVGPYVFEPALFDVIDAVERDFPAGADLDDVPAMQRLLASGRLIGRRIRGRFFDVGLPQGYHEANKLLESPQGAGSGART